MKFFKTATVTLALLFGALSMGAAPLAPRQWVEENYRNLGDQNIYRPIGYTDFTWSSERQDILDAMNSYGVQPYIYEYGDGYSEFNIDFPCEDRWYWGYAYAPSDSLSIGITVYSDWWDPETEEYYYDEAYVVGTRESRGYDRSDPIDKIAKNSDLTAASARITTLESSILGGEVKILRTGEDWQFGSGWGYLTRSIASDYRKWRIRVPKATYSGMSGSLSYSTSYIVATSGVSKTGKNISMPLYGIGSGRLKYSHQLVHTEGTRGTDAVQLADYKIGLLSESTDAAAGYYINMSLKHVSASPMVYYVTIDPTGWTLNGDGTMTRYVSFPKVTLGDVTEENTTYYSRTYQEGASSEIQTMTIPVGPFTFTNTVSLAYTLVDHIKHFPYKSVAAHAKREPDVDDTAKHTGTISLTFSTSQLENQYITSSRVVTSDISGLFYDAGQDCTYKIDVTNGCFFTVWYMDGDWRKEPAQ